MNDLRSRNRTLAPVRPLGPSTGEIVTAPPRARATGNPLFQDSRAGSEPERAASGAVRAGAARVGKGQAVRNRSNGRTDAVTRSPDDGATSPLNSPVSQELRTMPVSSSRAAQAEAAALEAEIDLRDGAAGSPAASRGPKAPASRPSKRRDVVDENEQEEEKFPWHFSFAANNDEPQELQAKSPLLARAFRSSVG